MGKIKLNKSNKIVIGFIALLIFAFLIYVIAGTIFSSAKKNTTEDGKVFGAVSLPIESELTGLGLENSVISDHIDNEHQLHDYALDLKNRSITYNYYTKEASYGNKIKVITYSVSQDQFEKNIVPKSNISDSGLNGMSAKYFDGTYYYVSDNYTADASLQKSVQDGKVIMEKGNDSAECEIGTIKALYWYDKGVGYCFEAINMPELSQAQFVEMAGMYWNNANNIE